MLLLTLSVFDSLAQIIVGGDTGSDFGDPKKFEKWIDSLKSDYQGQYHFGFSEGESYLFIIATKDSCYAQLTYGDWGLTNGKQDFIWQYEPLNNVEIKGNKFYSDKTNGEFVIYNGNDKKLKGLVVFTPWRRAVKKGISEFGFYRSPAQFWHTGKHPYASYKVLNEIELQKMSLQDLKIMRNEIYARYGYIFTPDGEMDKYFRTQKWYSQKNKNVDRFMTGLEKRNINLIQRAEKK